MMNINDEIQKNEQLIKSVIWNIYPSLIEDEDILQIGRIALWNALKSYKNEEAANFKTYASRIIRNKIIDEVRKRTSEERTGRKTVITISLQEPLKNTDEMNVEDAICGSDDVETFSSDVKGWLDSLDTMERKIVYNKSKGKTDKQIARILNIHQTTVSRKVKKLKENMIDECL